MAGPAAPSKEARRYRAAVRFAVRLAGEYARGDYPISGGRLNPLPLIKAKDRVQALERWEDDPTWRQRSDWTARQCCEALEKAQALQSERLAEASKEAREAARAEQRRFNEWIPR